MSEFHTLWNKFAESKGNLHDTQAKLTITVQNMKDLCQQFYQQGEKEGMRIERNSQSIQEQVFGKKFF